MLIQPPLCACTRIRVGMSKHARSLESLVSTALADEVFIIKVKVIRQFHRPTKIKELQEFLGMVNFYHWFLPVATNIMRPLYADLTGQVKGFKEVVWTASLATAFLQTKEALARAALLAHPSHDAQTRMCTDASDVAVGAVLEQHINVWCPLAFLLANI